MIDRNERDASVSAFSTTEIRKLIYSSCRETNIHSIKIKTEDLNSPKRIKGYYELLLKRGNEIISLEADIITVGGDFGPRELFEITARVKKNMREMNCTFDCKKHNRFGNDLQQSCQNIISVIENNVDLKSINVEFKDIDNNNLNELRRSDAEILERLTSLLKERESLTNFKICVKDSRNHELYSLENEEIRKILMKRQSEKGVVASKKMKQ